MAATATAGTVVEQITGTTIVVSGMSAVSGDYLVVHVAHTSATPPAAQAGWTRVLAPPPAAQTLSMTTYYQKLTAAAASTYSFPVVTGAASALPIRVQGADPTTFLDAASTITSQALATTFSEASATTTVSDVLALGAMALNGTTQNITPIDAAYTELSRATGTGKRVVAVSEARPTAGAIGTRTWTTGGSNTVWVGVRLHIRSAPVAFSGSLAVTGVGSLSLGGTPALPGSMAVTGVGSLVMSGVLGYKGSLAVIGIGTLALNGVPRMTGTLTVVGVGTLVVSSTSGSGLLAVAGVGTLGLNGIPRTAGTLAVVGVGSLSLSGIPNPIGTLLRTGVGLLLLTGMATTRVKWWDGAAWQQTILQYWDGSAWQIGTVKVWTGSAWS